MPKLKQRRRLKACDPSNKDPRARKKFEQEFLNRGNNGGRNQAPKNGGKEKESKAFLRFQAALKGKRDAGDKARHRRKLESDQKTANMTHGKHKWETKMRPGESWVSYCRRMGAEKYAVLEANRESLNVTTDHRKLKRKAQNDKRKEMKKKRRLEREEALDEEKDQLLQYDNIEFNEVVDRPPELSMLPKFHKIRHQGSNESNNASFAPVLQRRGGPSELTNLNEDEDSVDEEQRLSREEEAAERQRAKEARRKQLAVMREQAIQSYRNANKKKNAKP